jgi:hypothetical protein
MKWIKTFEELDPKVYRRAGSSLSGMGKYKRGSELSDYGYKKEFGVYNMHFANTNTLIVKDAEFSSPSYKITLGSNTLSGKQVINNNIKGYYAPKITQNEIEEMLDDWFYGNREHISFTINFYFKALSTAKNKYEHESFERYKDVPMFSMEFSVAANSQEYKRQLESDNPNDPISDAPDLWNEIKQWEEPQVRMWRPIGHYFGIFADRKSANKFKREVYSKAIEDSQEIIFEIFSQLGGDTKKLEQFNKMIKNIRINRLYDDETDGYKTNRDFSEKWYTGYSLIPGTEWSDY